MDCDDHYQLVCDCLRTESLTFTQHWWDVIKLPGSCHNTRCYIVNYLQLLWQAIVDTMWRRGAVGRVSDLQSCDQEVVGSTLGRARGVKTLGKFLTPVCLTSVHQAVQVDTGQRAVMPCGWGVKAGMVCVWVAGKTVWSPCYTRAISECFRGAARRSAIQIHVYFTLLYS